MATPTKFTSETRRKIIEALSVGASRRTAAAIAGVDHKQISRWVERGSTAPAESTWRRFYEQVLEAEAHPKMRALGVIYNELPGRPDLAWKFIERRESGYAPPSPQVGHSQGGPVIIQLALHDGSRVTLAPAPDPALPDDITEGELVDEQDDSPAATPSEPA